MARYHVDPWTKSPLPYKKLSFNVLTFKGKYWVIFSLVKAFGQIIEKVLKIILEMENTKFSVFELKLILNYLTEGTGTKGEQSVFR